MANGEWRPDPSGEHELRYFSEDGSPTGYAKDGGTVFHVDAHIEDNQVESQSEQPPLPQKRETFNTSDGSLAPTWRFPPPGERWGAFFEARRVKVVRTSFAQSKRPHLIGRAVVGTALLGPVGGLAGAATSKSESRNMVRTNRTNFDYGVLTFTDESLRFVSRRKSFSPMKAAERAVYGRLSSEFSLDYQAFLTVRFTPRHFGHVELSLTFKEPRPDEVFLLIGPNAKEARGEYNRAVNVRNEHISKEQTNRVTHANAERNRNNGKPSATMDVADEIRKLADLRDNGILTEDEFLAQKAKLLA
jgi:hypothetical protein